MGIALDEEFYIKKAVGLIKNIIPLNEPRSLYGNCSHYDFFKRTCGPNPLWIDARRVGSKWISLQPPLGGLGIPH